MNPLFGVINLNKPAGITSRAALNRLQQQLGKIKLGHGGTLDPLAQGVLLVLVGKATRLMPYVHDLPKHYRGRFRLGVTSDTEDIEGTLVDLESPPQPSEAEIEAELPRWTGTIEQRPPAYSAIKVDGKRAYRLAREGQSVELPARPVAVHQLELLSYKYPHFELSICCGGGTYVRSLGRDIAAGLGTAAVMTDLPRTGIGDFHIDESVQLAEFDSQTPSDWLLSARRLVPQLPVLSVSQQQWEMLASGQAIDHSDRCDWDQAIVVDEEGELLGIVGPTGAGRIRPLKSFRL